MEFSCNESGALHDAALLPLYHQVKPQEGKPMNESSNELINLSQNKQCVNLKSYWKKVSAFFFIMSVCTNLPFCFCIYCRREIREAGMTLIFDAKKANPQPQLYKALMTFQVKHRVVSAL